MRNALLLLSLMLPVPALAHPGHLSDLDGHSHYLAAWALIGAIGGAAWLIRAELRAPRKAQPKRRNDDGAGA